MTERTRVELVWRFGAIPGREPVAGMPPPPPAALGEVRATLAAVVAAPMIDRAARAMLADLLERVDWSTGAYAEREG